MSGQCDSGSCDTASSSQECGPASRGGCGCGTSGCSGDPTECAAGMWSCGFMTALKAVQVDILKQKIQKAWGPKMDKAADAVLEAMGAQWQSALAQAKAKVELREKLRSLWQ